MGMNIHSPRSLLDRENINLNTKLYLNKSVIYSLFFVNKIMALTSSRR